MMGKLWPSLYYPMGQCTCFVSGLWAKDNVSNLNSVCRIIRNEVLAHWQRTEVKRKVQIHSTPFQHLVFLVEVLKEQGKFKIRENPKHVSIRVLATRIVDSFFSVTSIPVLRFSTSCLPPCPVFVLALFLWPLQWSVATAELLVSTQLRCITRPGVPASYLPPGVVFVCVHLRSESSFMHALSLGPHTQGLGRCMFWVSPTSGHHIGLYHGLVCMYPFSTLPTRSKCLVQHASFSHSCLSIQPPVSMLNCFLANIQTIVFSIMLKDILPTFQLVDDLLYLATSTPCVQHNGLICGGVVLSCLTLQQEKCEIKFTGGRRSLLSFSSILKPNLDVKYKLARWLFSFHFHNPILMFLICVTELSLSFCWISVVSREPLCP